MNINFGLLPPVEVGRPEGHVGRWRGTDKQLAKKRAMTTRALQDLAAWA
jgi:methylenetetrahydrofolate--tRNA-(uracil-5-)-methyltransferase